MKKGIGLTKSERRVLDYLSNQEGGTFVSPTEIGSTIRGEKYHSAWASPICLRLCRKMYLERSPKGWYRIRKKK